MARRVVAQAQHHARKAQRVGLQHAQVDVAKVLQRTGVVGVALHQHQLPVDGEHGRDRAVHVAHRARAGGQQQRLARARHLGDEVDPGDVARADLPRRHQRGQLSDRLVVVRRAHEVDAGGARGRGQLVVPRAVQFIGAVDVEDGLVPLGLVALLRAERCKARRADDLFGLEVLELGAVGASLFCQPDQGFGTLQVTVVVGGDVGDEVARRMQRQHALGDPQRIRFNRQRQGVAPASVDRAACRPARARCRAARQ